jgi:hypothetical protein
LAISSKHPRSCSSTDPHSTQIRAHCVNVETSSSLFVSRFGPLLAAKAPETRTSVPSLRSRGRYPPDFCRRNNAVHGIGFSDTVFSGTNRPPVSRTIDKSSLSPGQVRSSPSRTIDNRRGSAPLLTYRRVRPSLGRDQSSILRPKRE